MYQSYNQLKLNIKYAPTRDSVMQHLTSLGVNLISSNPIEFTSSSEQSYDLVDYFENLDYKGLIEYTYQLNDEANTKMTYAFQDGLIIEETCHFE